MSKTRFRHKIMEAVHSVDVRRPGSKGAQQWLCQGLKLSSRGRELYAAAEDSARVKGDWSALQRALGTTESPV
jgi:hypothetical protein